MVNKEANAQHGCSLLEWDLEIVQLVPVEE